jgi:hypothetical protein
LQSGLKGGHCQLSNALFRDGRATTSQPRHGPDLALQDVADAQGAWMRLVSSWRHDRPVAGGVASATTFSSRQHKPVLGPIWAQRAMPCGSSWKSLVDDDVQWPHLKSALFAHHRKVQWWLGRPLLFSSKLVAWGLLGLNNGGGPRALFAQK